MTAAEYNESLKYAVMQRKGRKVEMIATFADYETARLAAIEETWEAQGITAWVVDI